jgi:hypothetical protein
MSQLPDTLPVRAFPKKPQLVHDSHFWSGAIFIILKTPPSTKSSRDKRLWHWNSLRFFGLCFLQCPFSKIHVHILDKLDAFATKNVSILNPALITNKILPVSIAFRGGEERAIAGSRGPRTANKWKAHQFEPQQL